MKKQEHHFSRRNFIKTTAVVSGLASISPLQAAAASVKTTGKLRHACIGAGRRGLRDLEMFLSHPETKIVAVCDEDEKRLEAVARLVPEARLYSDWRALFRKESENIDSVNVSIPDHNHYAVTREAIVNGKHVFCQSPLCHDVAEVRELTRLSARAGITSQLGTEHASREGDRMAVALLQQGVLGKIRHVYLASNDTEEAAARRLRGPRPVTGKTKAPRHLNWKAWLGTAPEISYAPGLYEEEKWRGWQEFGAGWSADRGSHLMNAVWKGLELSAPESVHADVQYSWQISEERSRETWPQSSHITWIFPGNKATEDSKLTVEWFDGTFYVPKEIRSLYSPEYYPKESAMIVGTKGAMLLPLGGMPVLLPGTSFEEVRLPEVEPKDHYHDFVDACLSGEKTESDFSVAGPMSEALLLGSVAMLEAGKTLKWEAAGMKFPDHPWAERHLSRRYRGAGEDMYL